MLKDILEKEKPVTLRQFLDQSKDASVNWLGGNKLNSVSTSPSTRKQNPVQEIIDSAKGGTVKFLGGVKNEFVERAAKVKDMAIGVGKGIGEMVTNSPLVSTPIGVGPFGPKPKIDQEVFKPANTEQKIGRAIGTLSPGVELIEPFLKEKGVNPGLAFGAGLVTDILVPGPGELGAVEDITTTILKRLKGHKTVPKQFIQDISKMADIRAPDRELVSRILDSIVSEDAGRFLTPVKRSQLNELSEASDIRGLSGREAKQFELLNGEAEAAKQNALNNINVDEFTKRVRSELLPLQAIQLGGEVSPGRTGFREYGGDALSPQYENVTLQDDLRGPVSHYYERVYESPVTTSGGDYHFREAPWEAQGGDGSNLTNNYFAHARLEDLPPDTRRVIELQSDLFQRGRLEQEVYNIPVGRGLGMARTPAASNALRRAEIDRLKPYEDNWYERIIREEVKKAAKDGKSKLQFPTGETAMHIEGIGEGRQIWSTQDSWQEYSNTGNTRLLRQPNYGTLKVGDKIVQSSVGAEKTFVVTKLLSDGKFRAGPYDKVGDVKPGTKEWDEAMTISDDFQEDFDISGKIDTNNPVYRFYESEVGKFLKNKFGAEKITDERGVDWWQMKVKPEYATQPVLAYGKANIATLLGLGLPTAAIAGIAAAERSNNTEINNTGLEPAMRINTTEQPVEINQNTPGLEFNWIDPGELQSEEDVNLRANISEAVKLPDVSVSPEIRYSPDMESQLRNASAFTENNPMSLVFVGQEGATEGTSSHVGSDTKTYSRAKFDTPEAGLRAGIIDVVNKFPRFETLADLLKAYIDPGAENTYDYRDGLKTQTGLSLDTDPNTMDKEETRRLIQFILKNENVLWYQENQGEFVNSVFDETWDNLINNG